MIPADVSCRPIVVVEDSDEDYEVTVWALREAGVFNPLFRAASAASIADLLVEPASWPVLTGGPFPLLLLLDLNLPGANGRDTLAALRRHSLWRSVPVVIVSTSRHEQDVAACYRVGAAGYLQKPLDLDAFATAMQQVADYWLKTVVPPIPSRAARSFMAPT
jgi:two-component system response regulator